MKRDFRRAIALILLGALSASAGSGLVRAQEATPMPEAKPAETAPAEPKTPETAKSKEERKGRRGGDTARQFLERFGRFRALDKHERDHESVKVAFRDVVSEPHKSTVRVLCNDKAVCLGCIIDADGYILTKASEVKGNISVKLHDNRLFDATLIGVDRKSDLAMLKVDSSGLSAITWRDVSDSPAVGSLLASSGLETLPVAIGVVSVQAREITAPSGVLGVMLEDSAGSAKVHEVFPSSGAEKAGIKPGDFITSVNGQAVENREKLVDAVRQYQPGDKVALKVKRGDQEMDMTATLMARPSNPDNDRKDFQNMLGGPLSERRAGFPLAIQHDTVLSPQDCGGPLVDLDGRAVGINIARAGRVNSYALPTSVILPLVNDLKSGKLAPGPTTDDIKLKLARRWDELKKSETTLGTKLSQLLSSIQMLQQATDGNREELLKRAEADKAATESELGKVKAELEKIQHEKTSLEK
ncbi:MAG TPA: PDZ domain-containing protein [Pirellulaceae bacterium]|nr:PDZ domain-containing protein [Pirellulaceae bacterium]